LSCGAFPRASPSSTFARPFFQYRRSGNEREAALGELAREPADLGLVQQQAPVAARIGVVAAGLLVGRDVQVHEQRLAAPHGA
jgi:hypothetical protein